LKRRVSENAVCQAKKERKFDSKTKKDFFNQDWQKSAAKQEKWGVAKEEKNCFRRLEHSSKSSLLLRRISNLTFNEE
jgi:hypothetical protein